MLAENVEVIVTAPSVSVTVGLVEGIVAVGLGNLYAGVGAPLGLELGDDEELADELGDVLGEEVPGVVPPPLPPPHAAIASASAKAP